MPANGQPDLWVEGAQTLRVTEVQALVKYATEVRGSWVTIELGSTASLTNSEETLESVSAHYGPTTRPEEVRPRPKPW